MFRLTVLYGSPVDRSEFERYYAEVHVPLALRIPGLRRFTYGQVSSADETDTYAIAELDWDSEEQFIAGMESDEGKAAASDLPLFATGGVSMIQAQIADLVASSAT